MTGYRFNDNIRTDLNLQYSELKYKLVTGPNVKKQNIKTMAAFVNGYYDINFHESIVPYITAGIGVGRNNAGDLKETGVDDEDKRKGKTTTNFIWNIGAGAQYKLNKNFALDLGYKYMGLGKTKTNASSESPKLYRGGKQNIRAHQVMGSLIYSF
jgi:opacity protein-like surface antigen